MKGNVIVALIVGAALGFVVGRATKQAEPAKTAPVLAEKPSAPTNPTPAQPRPAGGGEDPNAVYRIAVGDSPSWGPSDALVTVVEATDFQCPFCSRGNDTLKQLKKEYAGKIRVAIKQNPLGFHQFAHMAAEAALAANEQGKYWEMHDKLFANNTALDRPNLEKYAQELQLDMGRFKAALDQQKFKDRIDQEQKLVVGLGAGGTPSFFINGRKVVGAQPVETFKKVIDEEMQKAEGIVGRGVARSAVYDEIMKGAATSPVMLPGGPAPTPAQNQPPPPPPTPTVQKIEIAPWSPAKGPKAAKVTIVEWSDFQCPFCSRGAAVVKQIVEKYPNDVKFVFRHQPLNFHPNAMPAAKAAMAANKQGKFFEMHDLMFGNQQGLAPEKYEEWAKQLNLNMAKFKADMESPEIADQIKKDSEAGMKVGANGTPTFFVNGLKVEGAQPFESFQSMIDQQITRANDLIKSGVRLDQVYDKLTSMAPPEPPRVKLEPGSSPLKGSKNAAVVIYVFSDFQCPFCSRAVPVLKQIEDAYGSKVAVYFKQNPLPFHDKAQLAAEASLAAHEQGKFWPMHDKLFANQSALERPALEGYAKDLGLDLNRFKAALDSGKFKSQIQKDLAQASGAGVSGTPSFLINGKLVVGAQPFEEFKKVIDEEMKKK